MSDGNSSPTESSSSRPRRSSITANTFSALFGRSNSTSGSPPAVAAQPQPSSNTAQGQPRRMSISTLGLSGTSPIQSAPFGFPGGRRASVSTAGSDSIDESAIEDDEGPSRSVPTTPFTRRMSFGAQALFNARQGNSSPGSTGRAPSYTTTTPLSPITDQDGGKTSSKSQASTQSKPRTTSDYSSTRSAEGMNWSEQFRSRAENAIARPSFSTSPTSTMLKPPTIAHERAKSVGEMQAPPPNSIPPPAPQQQSALRRKPDAVGERILRGDFYFD